METYPVIEAGCDWLTLTAVRKESRERLQSQGHLFLEREHRLGEAKKERGYHGISGTECGQVFIGDSETTTMLILRGSTARGGWAQLLGDDYRCTRIDIQCTVQLPEYDGELGHRLQRMSGQERERTNSKIRPKFRYAGEVDGGETRYWGAPSSDRLMRVYDKHKQSGEPFYNNAWRFEIQYRRHIARATWMRLGARLSGNKDLLAILQGQLDAYCVPVLLAAGEAQYVAGPPRNTTTAERRLQWIRDQVFPTMQKLDDAGYGDAVRALVFAIDE